MGLASYLKLAFTGRSTEANVPLSQALNGSSPTGIVNILIAEDDLLIRDVTLPKMPRSNLQSALALNIDSSAPFKKQTVAFGYAILGQDKQQMQVRQYLIHKNKLQTWQSELSERGVTVRKFLAAPALDAVLLDKSDEVLRPYKRWQKANIGLVAAALALLAMLGWQNVRALNDEVTHAQENLSALRQDIAQLRNTIAGQSDRSSGLSMIAERQAENAHVLGRMNALTQVLPDDTWVSLVSFAENELTLLGNTTAAPTDLIPIIASSDQFETPILVSGFALDDGSGAHRFELEVPFARAGE